jgi:polyisoprenoid-binding protein YceI
MMVSKVRGKFTSFSGDIVTGEPLLDSSVVATIDLSSIDTGMRLGRGNEDRQDWMKASRSALIVSAWVVGMPCGNPG